MARPHGEPDGKQLDLVLEQRQRRRRRAAERDAGDVGAGGLLQALHQQVVDRAETRDAVVQLARVGAGIGDELAEGRAGTAGLENSTSGTSAALAIGASVAIGSNVILMQELVDDEIVGGGDQERMAVGRSARDLLRADVAGRARLGLDDQFLTEPRLHADREQAHDGLGNAAGGIRMITRIGRSG